MKVKVGDLVEIYWGAETPEYRRGTRTVTEVLLVDVSHAAVAVNDEDMGWDAEWCGSPQVYGYWVHLVDPGTGYSFVECVVSAKQPEVLGKPQPISDQGKWLSGVDRYQGETGGPSGLKWL